MDVRPEAGKRSRVMEYTRRQLAAFPVLAGASGCSPRSTPTEAGWPEAWDRRLVESALALEDPRYDEAERMLTRVLGPGYRYHTKLHNSRVHPTRESLEYALYLLEAGGKQQRDRALATIDRVLGLQNRDPASKWYGIWGWYLEEAPERMSPADWNWADFNGATLLLIEFRHGGKLAGDLRERVREAILHCARSIVRRDVSMRYTNIAVKGTFVTLAAGELLGDAGIMEYARRRVVRLSEAIDESGSFDEYNSPTYARVTLANLTRIRMYVKDAEARRRAAGIERRCWLHLVSHWDGRRAQFAGPMSRCYSTDIGYPLWLEKSLGGRLRLARPDDVKLGGDAETAIHDFRCPEELAARFLEPRAAFQHREMYQAAGEGSAAVVGTCYINDAFSLGSVNRGDFWNQRRPVLAFFGGRGRPAATLTVRVIKDGYDFSSALLFSVQERGYLAGVVNFQDPGGDRHISLDMVKNGEFECGRLFLEFDFESLPDGFTFEEEDGAIRLVSTIIQAQLTLRGGRFGRYKPSAKVTAGKQSLVVTVDLVPPEGPKRVVWKNTAEAWAAFTVALGGPGEGGFGESAKRTRFQMRTATGRVHLEWRTPAGAMSLSAATRPAAAAAQVAAYAAAIDGKPIPSPRLSEEKLA
ncbi:MAG: hypothetical protein C0504_10545 [Candidatus Solibacter sp.]|nr:hypothetical protein [Candidatus Solibacter sp.]